VKENSVGEIKEVLKRSGLDKSIESIGRMLNGQGKIVLVK